MYFSSSYIMTHTQTIYTLCICTIYFTSIKKYFEISQRSSIFTIKKTLTHGPRKEIPQEIVYFNCCFNTSSFKIIHVKTDGWKLCPIKFFSLLKDRCFDRIQNHFVTVVFIQTMVSNISFPSKRVGIRNKLL